MLPPLDLKQFKLGYSMTEKPSDTLAPSQEINQNYQSGKISAPDTVIQDVGEAAQPMALKISIETLPHSKQLYNTVGNYGGKKRRWIKVSEMDHPTYELAVALHKLIEQHLTQLSGIPLKAIDDFDLKFEKKFKQGLHKPEDEPGDDPRSPYYAAHQFATSIERLFVQQAGFSWRDYEDFITKVWRQK